MIAFILAALLQSGDVEAAAAPVEPPMVTKPIWVRRPTGEDFARRYPKSAAAQQVQGSTATSCQITPRGTLTRCVTLSEEPADHGFGEASVGLMSLFKMQPQDADGASVEGRRIRVPVRWILQFAPRR